MEKNKNLQFIRSFSEIKISDILKKYKINSSNFYHGKVSNEKIVLVKKEIDNRLIRIYYERSIENES